MRVALLLAVFLTLAVIVAVVVARKFVRRRSRAATVAELEATNQQLDDLLARQREARSLFIQGSTTEDKR